MSKDIDKTVAILINAQAALARMDSSQRMIVGEKLAAALRNAGLLQRTSSQHEEYRLEHQIVAGPLDLTINASFKLSRSSQPFALRDLDADIPF